MFVSELCCDVGTGLSSRHAWYSTRSSLLLSTALLLAQTAIVFGKTRQFSCTHDVVLALVRTFFYYSFLVSCSGHERFLSYMKGGSENAETGGGGAHDWYHVLLLSNVCCLVFFPSREKAVFDNDVDYLEILLDDAVAAQEEERDARRGTSLDGIPPVRVG